MIALSRKQGTYEAFVGRGLEGFQRRSDVELQPSGIKELDAVLGGGFPRGSLVELCGPASSGRTSLAFSLLAQATERQEACAFVDVSDSLDPISLAAAGVELPRLLWIRCGKRGTVNRISRALRILLLQARKAERVAVSIRRAKSRFKCMVGGIRAN